MAKSNSKRNSGKSSRRSESGRGGSMLSRAGGGELGEGLEDIMDEVKDYFEESRNYVSENPREAAGLAIAAGFAAWALLGTKPGRSILEAGAGFAVPEISKWFSRNVSFGGMNMGRGGDRQSETAEQH
jgi:hypothetical protein